MSLNIETKIGKKYALYIPKVIVEALDLEEGSKVVLRVEGRKIILEVVKDPICLALEGKKFASLTPEEIERISMEEQNKHAESTD